MSSHGRPERTSARQVNRFKPINESFINSALRSSELCFSNNRELEDNTAAPKRSIGRLVGGWAVIILAVMGGFHNLTTSPIGTGDPLRDVLNESGSSSDSVITVIALIAFIAWGIHL